MARVNSSSATTIKPAVVETKDEKPVNTENDVVKEIVPETSTKKVIKTSTDKKTLEKKSATS